MSKKQQKDFEFGFKNDLPLGMFVIISCLIRGYFREEIVGMSEDPGQAC